MMSNQIKIIAMYLLILLSSKVDFAAAINPNDSDVRYTVHNLSNNTNINKGLTGEGRNYSASVSGQADQVCVFCHTPHNASPAIPLWNKVYPSDASYADGFRLYTSSLTLTAAVKTAKLTSSSESLLCLSCHDGKTAINVLHNSSYRDSSTGSGDAVVNFDTTAAGTFALGQQFFQDPMIKSYNYPNLGALRSADGSIPNQSASSYGNNLTDDHPIGFSYTLAQSQDTAGLKETPDAGIRLFGTTKRLECSSCHNPHVYYGSGLSGSTRINFDTDVSAENVLGVTAAQRERTPFLVVSNKGSKLCLSCHIK